VAPFSEKRGKGKEVGWVGKEKGRRNERKKEEKVPKKQNNRKNQTRNADRDAHRVRTASESGNERNFFAASFVRARSFFSPPERTFREKCAHPFFLVGTYPVGRACLVPGYLMI
jgi:hypothetical protein